ncbi:Complex 1 LYR protein [Kalmanozyma brasiliensis GHG001]|uniref:NADH dehydrogenase [ubiquinone] 1 beta subcomplex subunit 9 n=1 Tax=Kalmanozyma brasiliensis (strain GHG001) TaxID=1365824 RepID=V5EXK1_KALBG|nr:Complex 1 LYR protein [Kalmanozyma brasiliensis GHG001]EST08243.1 Complex 1 LYR protein [Kalmanozyma brasiliensis GHG001]
MFAAPILRSAAASSSSTGPAAAASFSQAHKSYVKSLYRRTLKNELDWCIRRDIWRDRAIEIRVEFERNRHIRNPRELANLFEKAERDLKRVQHPDPHRPAMFEDGTKWERNLPPPMFSEAEKKAALDAQHH